MPRIPRLPKQFPYRHLVMFFIVAMLVGIAAILDALFMEDFLWIDLIWAIPIITAAFLLTPIEVLGFGLVSVVLNLASQVESGENVNLWTSAMVGVFALVVAITATTIRRYFERVNVIRDALGESPLAYAEFSFPGYKLLNNNQTFDLLAQGRSRPGALPHELMDKRAAEEMAAAMDEAVNTRRRVYREEFQILSAE